MSNIWFWRICCSYILGVVFIASSLYISIEIILIAVCLLILWGYFIKPQYSLKFGLIAGGLFFGLGMLRFQISTPTNQENHIIHLKNTTPFHETVFKVLETLPETQNWYTYKAQVLRLNKEKKTGLILIKLQKQNNSKLQKGKLYAGRLKINPLKKEHWTYTFNYNNSLINQNITHISWIKSRSLIVLPQKKDLWITFSHDFRNQLRASLKKIALPTKVLQITEALIFGYKKNIDKQLLDDFSKAGVIHILAISGLHIGIIYLSCLGLLKLLLYRYKHRYFRSAILLLILWLFVWFTNFSASALRATTMFSCFEISKLLLRKQHPLNALFLAVFILVTINPIIIFSVGFQLSVVAVISIIIGVPIFNNLWQPTHFINHHLWRIIGVSMSAQIGLLPLSMYYFHQVPGLFLVANIPIMLCMPLLMGYAFIFVLGNYFFMLPTIIVKGYISLINLLINFIHWVASFENFVLKDIYISIYSTLGAYVIFGYLWWHYYTYKKGINTIYIALSGIVFLSFTEKNSPHFKKELWLLNDYKNTIITEIASNRLSVFSEYELTNTDKHYKFNPVLNQLHSNHVSYHKLKQAYTFNHKNVLIVNQNFIPKLNIPIDMIVLTNTPKINLDRLITELQPKHIVFAAHNKFYLKNKWIATCEKMGIPYWDVSNQGSLRLTRIMR